MPSYWFTFNGIPADPSDPSNYTLVGTQEPTCSGFTQICAIYANNSGGYPYINCSYKDYIMYALNTRSNIPELILLKD